MERYLTMGKTVKAQGGTDRPDSIRNRENMTLTRDLKVSMENRVCKNRQCF